MLFTETRSRTHRSSLASQYRRRRMLEFQRREVRTCECDMDLPNPGRRPVIWQGRRARRLAHLGTTPSTTATPTPAASPERPQNSTKIRKEQHETRHPPRLPPRGVP